MATNNQYFDVLIIRQNGQRETLTLVHWRIEDETERQYQERFADIVSYCNGVLSDIERIRTIQNLLLCQGYKLSNTILARVEPLRDYK